MVKELKSMIIPDLYGKKFRLILGFILIMLLTMSSSLVGANKTCTVQTNHSGDLSDSHAEIIFVDGSLQDVESLMARLAESNFEVIQLDPRKEGFSQMATVLAPRKGIAAVHILSHGANGEVILGKERLNYKTIDAMTGKLAAIGRAMSDNGDIFLYGCNVGQAPDFVKRIADLTGTEVAASNDLTGAKDKGGDWDLELSTGQLEARSLQLSDYGYALGYKYAVMGPVRIRMQTAPIPKPALPMVNPCTKMNSVG